MRLEFESDALHRMAVLHEPPAEHFAETYDYLYAAFRGMYGDPQVDRAPLPAACGAAVADCMTNGNSPKGAVWSWVAETAELQPTWNNGHAVIEERYTREDAAAR